MEIPSLAEEPGAARPPSRVLRRIAIGLLLCALGCGDPALEAWHTEELTEEFTAAKADVVRTFEDYLQLEDRLFAQLDEEVYARVETGPSQVLVRYSDGSVADPRKGPIDWNRSFERTPASPVGGVLLLHGMSDSPYSLRALADTLERQRYRVIGLRLPGHGTAPSGLRHVSPDDMNAAVRIAMEHLAAALDEAPVHIVGYSTGAALGLGFALDALEGAASPLPASLVLISPAIRIHPAAGLARFSDALSALPGLEAWGWLSILPEFDPFKYNSFATNAGSVVHRLTRSVDARIAAWTRENPEGNFPPILVFKSTVDATVTTEAVVDRLLDLLPPHRNELVLFDINRSAATSTLLIADPAPLTDRMMNEDDLPFEITFVTNEHPETRTVVALHKDSLSAGIARTEKLGLEWPRGVVSLSHVALPIPPDDPLYGRFPPEDEDVLFLGEAALRGERGLLVLPDDWLLRMRYNPFYEVLERRVLDWFEKTGAAAAR